MNLIVPHPSDLGNPGAGRRAGEGEPHRVAFLVFAKVLVVGVIAVGAVMLTGCAHYQPKPIALDRTAIDFESRSLTQPELREFLSQNLGRPFPEWPLPSWDFETLTWAAFHYHPSLDVARAQWAVAIAGRTTASARPNPTASVTPGYNFSAADGISPWFPGIAFDVPLETAGKRGKRINRAQHLAESARLNITTAAWQVRGGLRTALIDLSSTARRRGLLQDQAVSQRRMVELLEQRLAAGSASTLDVSITRLALIRGEADLAEARRIETESRLRLAEALGVPASAVAALVVEFPLSQSSRPRLHSVEARRAALQHRADILAALALYEASQASVQIEIARQYPDIHLGSGYQWDQGDSKWNLALTLELPIFNRNQGPIAEAEARRQEAAAHLLALQAKVISEIDRSTAAQAASDEQLNETKRMQAGLLERLKLIESRLSVGGADQLDYQNAKVETNVSALAILNAEIRSAQASGLLEDALQIPFQALSTVEKNAARPLPKN